jgi:hypothetical protein
VTRRLGIILALGVIAMLVSGALALDETRTVHQPQVSPSWGMYTDAQWRTLQERYGSIQMVASEPAVSAVASRGCIVVVHGMTHLATVCRPSAPLRLIAWRAAGMTHVIGITNPSVTSVVTKTGNFTEGVVLQHAPHAYVFAGGFKGLTNLTVYGAHGRVLEQLQVHCASALRGACGISEQRRS